MSDINSNLPTADSADGSTGSSAPATAIEVAGKDGSGNLQPLKIDGSGNLQTINTSSGPVTPGTVATNSSLIGGQFNTSLPTLTNGQQSAIQTDSSGRLLIAGSVTNGVTDKSTFTYGSSQEAPIGGVYQDTSPTLSAGQTGALRLTSNRGLHINLRDSSGTELGNATTPVVAKLNDGTHASVISANHDLQTVDVLQDSGTQGAVTVGTSAVAAMVGVGNLANRKLLTIFNNSSSTIYWGYTSGVTTSTGTLLFKSQFLSIPAGPNSTVYLIAGSAGNEVRITESA